MDYFYVYKCVNVASFDYAPWVWNSIVNPLPTVPLPSAVSSIFTPSQRICPGSFVFYSNNAPCCPSVQKEALFRNFNMDYTVNGQNITVPINYAAMLYENFVTQNEAADFFQTAMHDTQDAIDAGSIATDGTTNAIRSNIRLLFFNTYNTLASNTYGFGNINYYLEEWRSASYSVPVTCP